MSMRNPLWFVVATAIAIGSPIAAYHFAKWRLIELDRQVEPIRVADSASIHLDQPGAYTIFYEETVMPRGPNYIMPSLSLQLIEESSGQSIALTAPSAKRSYNIVGRMGTSVMDFTIVRPGSYLLRCSPVYGGPATLSVAQGAIGGMFEIVVFTLCIAVGGLALAGFLVTITIIQFKEAARAKLRS
jgi:hypothetical protein